jgi:hypothetical protein
MLPKEVPNVNSLRFQAENYRLNRKINKIKATAKPSLIGIEVEMLTE